MTVAVVCCIRCQLVGRLKKYLMFAEPDEPCPYCRGCRVCGESNLRARGRCITDHQFRRRNGRDRSDDEIIRANKRRLDKKLAGGA